MKRIKLWAGAGGAGALLLVIWGASQERKAPSRTPDKRQESFEVGLTTAQEIRAMLGAYGKRVEETEKGLAELRRELGRARSGIEEAVRTLQEEAREADPPAGPAAGTVAPIEPIAQAPRFRTFDFGEAPKGKTVHIPAGSFAEATLLTGVYAPTNGEPLPVLLRLDAALVGPNRTRLKLHRALLVGKAIGDANARRATVQIDTLSLATESGRTVDVRVNGWIADDDGVQGLRGTYVWRAEEIAMLAAGSAGLAAAADALSARHVTSTVTPLGGATSVVTGDAVKFAGLRGAGGAAQKISEVVSERLKEIVPAVYVPNGRIVTVAFVSSVTIDGLSVEEVPDDEDLVPYRGLDADR